MTVAQLRKVAETFGLKSMRKNVLVEQLTAIWHRLNPDPKPRTEPEPEPVEDEQDQDRDQDGDGGIHVVDGTFAESSFGPSQGHRCVGKGKGRADDYEPTRSSRRYDASTIFSSDLDEDGEGSGGSESDLDDESDDEEEEDEDMDLDPENEGEGSIERTARGGFGGGGPDDNDDLDDLGKEDPEDREKASPTLERRLLQFLNSRPRFRKHLLMYKPLDLEVVWAECDAAGIECTRKELRQFLDRRGIICIVPADSVYMSPLWSVANQRRTSMLEENRQKEQKAAQILESEIRQHLDGLEEQVQRAKKEAHAKILSSLEKYNEQVRRPKIPSPAKHILVSEDEGDHKDVDNRSNHDDQEQNMDMEDIVNTQDTLDLDDYPRPSSPLLRFSRRADGVKDAAGSPNHVIELHSDPPVSDHYSYDYNEDISFDNNYSPNNNCLSPRKNNYSPCDNDYKSNPLPDGSPTLELDRSMELHQVDDLVDVDNGGVLVYSPPVSPQFGTTRVPPRTQHQLDQSDTSFSSPPQLPPPLDFAKLGFPGAANLVQVPMDEPDLTPPPPDTWSILSPGLISRRLDRMRTIGSSNGSLNDVDDFPEDDLQASDDTSRWRNVSTPKRKAHSRSRDTALANGHDQDDRDEVGDSEDIPTRVPRRPKSATKTRSIAPFRRVTAAVTLYGMAFMNRANQFSASQSQSQLEDTTAASAPPSSSQAGVATPSRKKNKTGLDVRVEAMARESARLANNFRKQHE
ncbi:hypothetical protein BG005_003599, partial [Podila minutissima]